MNLPDQMENNKTETLSLRSAAIILFTINSIRKYGKGNKRMPSLADAIVYLTFGILGLAVIAWVAIIIPELRSYLSAHKRISSLVSFVFNAAPVQDDTKKAGEPIKVVVGGLIPLILWILILVPMFVFPIILILFPLLHIPWSYLLPPVP